MKNNPLNPKVSILDCKCSTFALDRENTPAGGIDKSINAIIDHVNSIDFDSTPKPCNWASLR